MHPGLERDCHSQVSMSRRFSWFFLTQCIRSARTRILGLLYRDGIVYYSITLVVLVGGILVRLQLRHYHALPLTFATDLAIWRRCMDRSSSLPRLGSLPDCNVPSFA